MTMGSEFDESKCLAALLELGVLDTPPESVFDGLVKAAALACGTSISQISLIDHDRQWIKASVGLQVATETPREHAFCSMAIRDDQILEVADAAIDPRFAGNPLVTGDPGIRFYAGAPLCLSNGARVGALCVIDNSPGKLTSIQRALLGHLAAAVVKMLEARRVAFDLKSSEARFRALSDSSPLGVFATDVEGACTYTNARWRAIFGLSEAQAYGSGWSLALHPEDRSNVFLDWQQAAESGLDFDREFRILRGDDSMRYVRALSRPVLAEGGETISHVGTVEDVTERKAQQLALRKSETLLNETGALADIGGWDLDLPSGILSWSDHTCRIHGLEPGYRPQLQEALDFYAPEARRRVREAVERAIADGQGWEFELPLVRADQTRIWVRAVGHVEFENGEPVRLLGAIQDITRRVEQRQALESAHERMLFATDSGGIGVWEWNITSATVDWTPRMYELYSMAPHSGPLSIEHWVDRVHHEDRDRFKRTVDSAIAGEGSLDAELRVVKDDGHVRHLCVAARITHGVNGEASRMLGVSWDVTALRTLNTALSEQRELLHVTLQSIGDAVITTDAARRVTWLNPAAEQMTGWLSADASGKPLTQIFRIVHEQTRQPVVDSVELCPRHHDNVSVASHTVLISRRGTEFGIEESAAPIRSASGELLGVVLVFHDVSEQRRLSGEMSYRATHDALTGLLNRAELEARLERALTRSRDGGVTHALMYIDLDQFKLVNDACGHTVGDELLKQVARLMGSVVRSNDSLARFGGDEFAVILEDCTSDQAQRVAQEICERMDDFRFVHEGRRFRIGASIGLVPIDNRWTNIAVALQAADVSCYAAKEAGRNRVHVWFDTDSSLRERTQETQWVTRLEHALDEDQFVLHAQRIGAVSATADGVHAEVLVRLHDEQEDRLVLPGAFLPAAERFHLATRIDRWVLCKVIEQLEALPDLSVVQTLCVNLSGQSIGDRVFHRDAIEALTSAGYEVCRRLSLEITETAAITNMEEAVAFAEQVRALGVGIALDDFGAGASSFGYLKTLPVDVLKIDGQYIRNMIDNALADAAVRCFVDVARLTGIRTVAEYVDRPEVFERVKAIGIDHVQGFLFHEPEPMENVLRSPELVDA